MPNYRTPRIVGRVIKGLLALLVLAVNALLIWRVFFSASVPKEIDTLLVNEHTLAAYEQHGEELILQYQDLATITRAESNYGYFSVPRAVFLPQAEQVQIIFRYNNSTLEHLREDYALAETPDRETELFDVTLVRTTDLTPENPDDNLDPSTLSRERYHASEQIRETTALYTYYRYVFDGVTVEELTDGIFVDVYYHQDIQYNQPAYGTLCIYDCLSEWLPYEASRADLAALREASEKGEEK